MDKLRRDYALATLNETEVHPDPMQQLSKWFQEAIDHQVPFPDAMTLSSVTAQGTPDSRIVLLKELTDTGLIFYTNYQSPTGQQLDTRPHASAVLWWPGLERQVRVRGHVERVSEETSDRYFQTRPRGAQLAAWASAQSEVIASRGVLEQGLAEIEQQFLGTDVPRPKYWGGYILTPNTMEFWQGRVNRLHDRLRFRRDADQRWTMERLAP
jgi:pyridoxamine 5'-phosphate oxidase